ncbi:MAG: SUF system NifU family Fe-S cluster assembly protein [Candidatus Omnitrophota bacterium]
MSAHSPDRAEVRLSELYQEIILDHNRHPRNFKALESADRSIHGVNPLCGDDYHLDLKWGPDGKIAAVGFQGQGCAISKASASMMTQAVLGKTRSEAAELKSVFLELLTHESVTDVAKKKLGSLKLFEGVRQFPVRVKCATLI